MTFVTRREAERIAAQRRSGARWEDERIQWFSHAHQPILFVDFSHCSADQVEKIAHAVPDHITKQPLGSVRVLSDFTGAAIDRETIRTMKESAVFDKPYVHRSAWIGADHFPQDLYLELKGFCGRELPKFRTRQDALQWLIGS